jgi:hypothetical protein
MQATHVSEPLKISFSISGVENSVMGPIVYPGIFCAVLLRYAGARTSTAMPWLIAARTFLRNTRKLIDTIMMTKLNIIAMSDTMELLARSWMFITMRMSGMRANIRSCICNVLKNFRPAPFSAWVSGRLVIWLLAAGCWYP